MPDALFLIELQSNGLDEPDYEIDPPDARCIFTDAKDPASNASHQAAPAPTHSKSSITQQVIESDGGDELLGEAEAAAGTLSTKVVSMT